MLLNRILALPAAVLLVGLPASITCRLPKRQDKSLEDYIKAQAAISLNGVLANIGPDGANANGAAAGAVIASPSKADPDCK